MTLAQRIQYRRSPQPDVSIRIGSLLQQIPIHLEADLAVCFDADRVPRIHHQNVIANQHVRGTGPKVQRLTNSLIDRIVEDLRAFVTSVYHNPMIGIGID